MQKLQWAPGVQYTPWFRHNYTDTALNVNDRVSSWPVQSGFPTLLGLPSARRVGALILTIAATNVNDREFMASSVMFPPLAGLAVGALIVTITATNVTDREFKA